MGTRFGAPPGPEVRVITMLSVAILLVVPVPLVVTAVGRAQQLGIGAAVLIALAGLDLAILGVAYLLAPTGYVITPSRGITILRHGPNIAIPAETITGAECDRDGAIFRGAVRVSASGGAFGFYGLFDKAGVGLFRAYATRRSPAVIIRRTSGGPLVLTPDDPGRFLALLGHPRPGSGP